MNVLDYVLIGILLFFLVVGFRKGFVWQALSIVAVGAAFFVAARFHVDLAESSLFRSLREKSGTLALVVSFIGIFFVLAGIGATLAATIGRRVTKPHLRPLDRSLGGLLGLAKGAVLLGALALALEQWAGGGALEPAPDEGEASGLVEGSAIVPHLVTGTLVVIDFVVDLVPPEDRERLVELYRKQLGGEDVAGGEARRELTGNLLEKGGPAPADKPAAEGDRRDDRRLLDLGALRRLTAEQREISEPAPAAAKEEEEASSR